MSCSLLEEIEAALIDVGDKELQPNTTLYINLIEQRDLKPGDLPVGHGTVSWRTDGKQMRSVKLNIERKADKEQ
jgi:hypothetical protein